MNENIVLFIFDFDGTLINGHSHNYIGQRVVGLVERNIKNCFFSSYEKRAEEIARLEQKFSIDLMKNFLADKNLSWKNKGQLVQYYIIRS